MSESDSSDLKGLMDELERLNLSVERISKSVDIIRDTIKNLERSIFCKSESCSEEELDDGPPF
jgi:septation ring formation regulator EzrA